MNDVVINKYGSEDHFGHGLLGIKIEQCSETHSLVSLDLEKKHMNTMGITHGGVIFSVMDIAAGVISVCRGKPTVTLNSSLSFMAPSYSGKIYAEATLLNATYRIVNCVVSVKDENDKLLANGQFTMYLKNYKKDDITE